MQTKLYYTEPTTATWTTTVVEAARKEDGVHLLLAETAIYPEGGGQPSDEATINGVAITAAYEQGEHTYVIVPQWDDSETVEAHINEARRIDHSVHHSAQHLLSAVIARDYGIETVSFHLGVDYCTIDLATTTLSNEQVAAIEEAVYEEIRRNLPIKTYWIIEAETSQYPLKKWPTGEANIRIVQMGELDYSACCGTHVAQTGEIGTIQLTKVEKAKGQTRLYFIAGLRAVKATRVLQQEAAQLTKLCSTNFDNVVNVVTKLQQELKEAKAAYSALLAQSLASEAAQLATGQTEVYVNNGHSSDAAPLLANALMEHVPFAIVVAASELKVWVRSEQADRPAGAYIKDVALQFQAKGGGSPKNGQMTFATEADLQAWWATVVR